VAINNPNIPIIKPDALDFTPNITVNISVDSADKWNTDDHGELSAASNLMHNWLGGLQGGASGEYYHLNSSEHSYLVSNIYDWVDAADMESAVLWEIQPSNNSIVRLKTPRHVNMSENDLYVRDIYASNETLYLGNSKLQGNDGDIEVVNGNFTATNYFGSGQYLTDLNLTDIIIDGGNITANYIEAIHKLTLDNESINNWSQLPQYFIFGDNWNYFSNDVWYFNESKLNDSFVSTTGYSFLNGTLNVTNIYANNLDVTNLTAREINAINITANTIDVVNMTVEDLTASTIFARNFTVNGTPEGFCMSDGTGCENATGSIYGVAPWIIYDGQNISFNETNLQSEAEIRLQTEVNVITVTGGTGSAITASLDFEIKEINVACTAGTKFKFEASETIGGAIVDKNRKTHTTNWRIEKNYPISGTLNLNLTSVIPIADSCTVTIKYLSQDF